MAETLGRARDALYRYKTLLPLISIKAGGFLLDLGKMELAVRIL
jgi:hypothetical protein